MKHLLLVAGLVGSVMATTAGINDGPQAQAKTNAKTLINPNIIGSAAPVARKPVESGQAISFVNVYQNDYSAFWENFASGRGFVYEPETNTLGIVHPFMKRDAQRNLIGGLIYAETSTDGGDTWARETIYDLDDNYMAWLETGLAAVNGVAKYFIFGINYQNDGTGAFQYAGYHGYTVDGAEPFPMAGPEEGNNDQYEWTSASITSSSSAGAPSVYFGGMLNPPTGVQYGAYGMWGYDMTGDNFTYNGMPGAWDLSKYIPSTAVDRSYNTPLQLDVDEDGAVYASVNNIFADDTENRVPAVSISDDRGANWSEFERMPASLIDTYAAAQVTAGRWPTPDVALYGTYENGDAFLVNGPNDWSYFFRLGHVNTQANRYDALQIVEARYRNGSWTMEFIADLNDFPPLLFIVDDAASNGANKRWTPIVQSVNGHEIEAAITKDRAHVVVKWVDANINLGRFGVDPPATVIGSDGNEGQLDSLFTTDIFFSVRANNSNAWSAAVNITNDVKVDKGTHIPQIIPSATKVPIIYHQGVRNADLNDTNYLKRMNWPDVWTEREMGRVAAGYFIRQTVRFGTFNALNPNSVQDVVNYAFELNDAVPNPAVGTSEITWTLDRNANVSLDLYTVLGTKVTTLSNGEFAAGVHGVSVNTNTLSAGSYYYTLTVDGVAVTKPLSIVK